MSSSSLEAARCRHIKVNGTQCGSPALRHKKFCFYHQDRPSVIECYSDGPYATGQIALPVFEDAHSIQTVIRQVVQMVLQKRLERKTASLLLYALQIASSNLKRIDLEKPQPEQVVIDVQKEEEWQTPIAAFDETASESSASAKPADHDSSTQTGDYIDRSDEDLSPGTIHASCGAGALARVWLPPARMRQTTERLPESC